MHSVQDSQIKHICIYTYLQRKLQMKNATAQANNARVAKSSKIGKKNISYNRNVCNKEQGNPLWYA